MASMTLAALDVAPAVGMPDLEDDPGEERSAREEQEQREVVALMREQHERSDDECG